jgi:hypothetical protein
MDSKYSDLPQDLDACHALIRQLMEEREQQREMQEQQTRLIDQQTETITEQQPTIDRLMVDLALLRRSLFGSRRERYIDDPGQGLLFNFTELELAPAPAVAEADEEKADPKGRRTSKGRGRRVFPDFLPRTRVEHELNEEDIPEDLRNDPSAKRFFKKTSEQVEYEPP